MIFTILIWAELEDSKTIRGTQRAARRGLPDTNTYLVFVVAVYVKFSNMFYIIFFLTIIPAIYTNGLIPSYKRNGE